MKLQQIIITLFLLSSSLCTSMGNQSEYTVDAIIAKSKSLEISDFLKYIEKGFEIEKELALHKGFDLKWDNGISDKLIKETVTTEKDKKTDIYKVVPQRYIDENKHLGTVKEVDINNQLPKRLKIAQALAQRQAEKEELEQKLALLEKKKQQQKKVAPKKNSKTMSSAEKI